MDCQDLEKGYLRRVLIGGWLTKETRSISECLHGIKSISDELAIINSLTNDIDLVIPSLNGLGSEFREVVA
ncbi:hypothetical protein JHK84_049980 [Glycine max]|nr:hypothetical protein JHK84_049980 [Glycine max]